MNYPEYDDGMQYCVVLLLLCSWCGVYAAPPNVYCSVQRIDGLNSTFVETRTAQHLLGLNHSIMVAALPWRVIPPTISVDVGPGSVRLVELANLPEFDELLKRHERLLAFELPKLEIGAVSSPAPSDSDITSFPAHHGSLRCATAKNRAAGDILELSWHDSVFGKSFSQYLVPCNYGFPMDFGVETFSSIQWGSSVIRAPRDGTVFAPNPGGAGSEDMTAVLAAVNSNKPDWVPFSIRFESYAQYPLISLTYRTCVAVDETALVSDVRQALMRRAGTPAPLPDQQARPKSVIGMSDSDLVAAAAESESPAVWPIRGCLEESSSGVCTAHFGYASASSTPVDIGVAPSINQFQPQSIANRAHLPTHFLPGLHEDAFRVRWVCFDSSSRFIPVAWTLLGSRVEFSRIAPRCSGPNFDLHKRAQDNVNEAWGRGSRNLV